MKQFLTNAIAEIKRLLGVILLLLAFTFLAVNVFKSLCQPTSKMIKASILNK